MADPRICSIPDCGKQTHAKKMCRLHYLRWSKHGDPNSKRVFKSGPQVTLRKVVEMETDDCIIWPHQIFPTGYGGVRFRGHTIGAHAAVLEITCGPAPEGMEAAHKPVVCHNRSCVNKRHLRWASPQENQLDKRLDGTAPIGSKHAAAKLVEADIVAIRRDHRPQSEIAEDYGVGQGQISRIKTGKRWKHVA